MTMNIGPTGMTFQLRKNAVIGRWESTPLAEGKVPASGGAVALFIDGISPGGGVGAGFHGAGVGGRGVGVR